ncbi:MAG: DNA polymerase III subunit psi [Sodalis sp. Fle]|nr:MAG: DNA polymerase III subunit psi [Sodalis sp. Fle]
MTIKRDWLLQQMGITQWTLRRSTVSQGKNTVYLPDHIRLLLVTDPLPPPGHPLVDDVVRSMALRSEQLLALTINQALMLPSQVRCHCWWLGLKATRNFNGICLSTPTLSILQKDPMAKRALWRQISHYK